MIELEKITFGYKGGISVFDDVSYTFNDGNTYVIQGNNGSGKTTLLRLICGLLQPSDGNIKISKNYTIGYLPDNNGIYENLTVLENIKFRIGLYNLSYDELCDEIDRLLINYALIDKKFEYVSALSLGMRKKTALICTQIIDPTLFILDEPTGGIDQSSRDEFLYMLNSMNDPNRMIICTSHDGIFIKEMKANKLKIRNRKICDENA